MTPLIEFRNVRKVYGHGQAAVEALGGIDLRIESGDFVAVMGPSGSGKSTAMNIVGCLDTPTSGVYLFKGVDVGGLSRNQRAPAPVLLPRFRVPGIQSSRPHLRDRERGAALDLSPDPGRRSTPAGARSPRFRGACAAGNRTRRASSPAGSNSGSPSRAPS